MDPIIRKSRLISIHTPAKGVTSDLVPFLQFPSDFNPHSREGSDLTGSRMKEIQAISIHTPAKGVTIVLSVLVFLYLPFQSTLPRRE